MSLSEKQSRYESVIGLEVHIQLLTKSKLFCSCSAKFGAEQNSQVCPVCLGMPGVLPVLNSQVIDFAIKLALATSSRINERSIFARKNYFYPDLPKGFQTSQFEEPFCRHGCITIGLDGEQKSIGLTRIHIEEDAGKSKHAEGNESLVDINRCGVPLLEIVSEPDIRSPKEARIFLTKLRQIVRYLQICDGNMEEGSLRCDANVSIRPVHSTQLGVKTELKNMNSFSSVERALEYEIERQIRFVRSGEKIIQQTMLWDADRNVVEPMRSKEDSHDYRYFPEPDLVPIVVDSRWIEKLARDMPELPDSKRERFISEYGIPAYDAAILTEDFSVADYFERVARKVKDKKTASNWVMGKVLQVLKENRCEIGDLKVTAEHLAEIIEMIESGVISQNIAKSVFDEIVQTGEAAKTIVQEKGLVQISDSDSIEAEIESVLAEFPAEVNAYLEGKDKLLGFFMGQVMRAMKGKGNPAAVNELLRSKLEDLKSE